MAPHKLLFMVVSFLIVCTVVDAARVGRCTTQKQEIENLNQQLSLSRRSKNRDRKLKQEYRNKLDEQAAKIEELEAYIRKGKQMCADHIEHLNADCEAQKKHIKQEVCPLLAGC